MFKIPKQEYTAEFKELAVKRVRSGQGIAAVARELGLVEQTLRNWVKAAKAGKLNPPETKAITAEQMELSRVRAENARLRMENEILKTAFAASRAPSYEKHAIFALSSDTFMSSTACLVGSSMASRRRSTVIGKMTSWYLPRT